MMRIFRNEVQYIESMRCNPTVWAGMYSDDRFGIRSGAVNRSDRSGYVRFALLAQPVDATQALNLSAGVSNSKVLRGRSFSWRATLFR